MKQKLLKKNEYQYNTKHNPIDVQSIHYRIRYPRVILRKGHIGQAFYLIFSGSVFVNIEGFNAETNKVVYKTVSTLHQGDAFGVRNYLWCTSCSVSQHTSIVQEVAQEPVARSQNSVINGIASYKTFIKPFKKQYKIQTKQSLK